MANFEPALRKTLAHEGGYVNHPDDPGGETNFGIIKREAVANGYTGPMIDIPMEVVREIYRKKYWDLLRLDDCQDQAIAEELFDSAVNMGVGTATRFLQRVLNFLNRMASEYPDVEVDGMLGPATMKVLNTAIQKRNYATAILISLRGEQYRRYAEITEANPKLENFFLGWILNRV